MNDHSHASPGFQTAAVKRAGMGFGTFLVMTAIVLINAAMLAAVWAGYDVALSKEHSALEFVQLVVLLPALALFWLGWRHGREAKQTASGALAMLTAAMFVRELDVKTLGGPDWFRWLSHHGLQEILLVAMTLPILWYLVRRRHHWRGLLRLLLAPAAIPLFVSGILLLVAVQFDREIAVNANLRFWEEFIELNGFMFLVLSAWNHWQIVRRRLDQPG